MKKDNAANDVRSIAIFSAFNGDNLSYQGGDSGFGIRRQWRIFFLLSLSFLWAKRWLILPPTAMLASREEAWLMSFNAPILEKAVQV
ncbi:hypothetical protein DWV07_16945 [Dickeya zeae]|nr:hypothetical protein DWV07_16945 [Dickeya zeae]